MGVSTSMESMAVAAGSLDLILNTVSATHDVNTYLPLLAAKGVIVQIGFTLQPHSVSQVPLIMKSLAIAGSIIGGLPATQDCIDFCHKHKIVPKTNLITLTDLDKVGSLRSLIDGIFLLPRCTRTSRAKMTVS